MRIFTSPILFLALLGFLSCQSLDNSKNAKSNHENEADKSSTHQKQILKPDSFPNKYDSVIAYDYLEDPNTNPLLDSVKRIRPIFKQRRILNLNQIIELKTILGDTLSFGGDSPTCFWPNFAVVFYSSGKVAHNLEISLMCNQIFSSFEISALLGRKYPEAGFSEKGRDRIYDLCKKLKFKQAMDKSEWCGIKAIN